MKTGTAAANQDRPARLNTVAVNTVEDVPPADDTPRLASPQFNFPHVADIVYHFLQDAMGGGFQGSVALVTRKSLCSGGTRGVEASTFFSPLLAILSFVSLP
jgi:hypothetical protein